MNERDYEMCMNCTYWQEYKNHYGYCNLGDKRSQFADHACFSGCQWFKNKWRESEGEEG